MSAECSHSAGRRFRSLRPAAGNIPVTAKGAFPERCNPAAMNLSEGSRMLRSIRHFIALAALVAVTPLFAGENGALLREAAAKWLDERDNWAFTQLAREYDGHTLKRERLERYDPSRPDAKRWELVELNGRKPTPDEKAELTDRKNRKRRRHTTPVADYFDFDRAVLLASDARTVRYELPLRSSNAWLFPVDKVALVMSIDRTTRAITHVQARIQEPFRVALGLARVLDVHLDVQTDLPPEDAPHSADPAAAKPSGTARMVVARFGDRIEYIWSDFKRVEPHPDRRSK